MLGLGGRDTAWIWDTQQGYLRERMDSARAGTAIGGTFRRWFAGLYTTPL